MSSRGAWQVWFRAVGQPVVGSAAVAVLLGCGGGGDAPPPAAAPGVSASSSGATCGFPDFQPALLARVNQARAAGASCGSSGVFGPAPALTWNDRLTQAATAHSQDMAAKNYFSHTSQDGRTPGARITAAGYAWSAFGENIAAGQTSVDSVMAAWMASPGHCANIMSPNPTEIGVACVDGSAGDTYSTYWTMDLARPG